MTIICGDCLDVMKTFPDNHFSAIVTDPPYGLSFMGKRWDYGIPGEEYWRECLRISRPGSYLLAMGGSRTSHRLTTAIEASGYEIRDTIMWLYGSGFPKSHNHFGIEGYGTALKPAYEPIIMAMKPCEGTFKQNAEKWGQAGINIDGCRIELNSKADDYRLGGNGTFATNKAASHIYKGGFSGVPIRTSEKGRWPANVIFDEWAAAVLGEPSRFFYCAKASSRERNEGLEGMPEQSNFRVNAPSSSEEEKFSTKVKNNHPTVKPIKLMEYLIKLIMPPKDGILLDPFAGSGTTILAAKRLGFDAIGIEKEAEYCEIAKRRVAA